MIDRILRSRYVRHDQGWVLGENLAWGTGAYGTPRGAMEAWMNSAGHRYTLLSDMWTSVGMVVMSAKVGSRYGVFWAADFGTS